MAFGADARVDWSYSAKFKEEAPQWHDKEIEEVWVDMLVYREREWEDQIADRMSSLSCKELTELAHYKDQVRLYKKGSWSMGFQHAHYAKFVPQVWFFAFADCSEKLYEDGTFKPFEIRLGVLNDTHHFSEEEDGMIFFYITAFVIFAAVLGTNIYKYIRDMIKYEKMESPMLILMMSATLNMGHILFQLIHLWFFSWNGKGPMLLDVFSTVQLIIAQISLAFLLCMLAWGWTITKQSMDMEDLDITVPIAIFIVVIHAIIGGLIFLDNDEHYK